MPFLLTACSDDAVSDNEESDEPDVSADGCQTWNEFLKGSSENVLLDFSYAGYHHGESAPPEVEELL